MHVEAVTLPDPSASPFIDDCDTAMDGRPGEDGRFAIVAVAAATEFRLVLRESDELVNLLELNYLKPCRCKNLRECRMIRDAIMDLVRDLGRRNSAVRSGKSFKCLKLPSASKMAEGGGVE